MCNHIKVTSFFSITNLKCRKADIIATPAHGQTFALENRLSILQGVDYELKQLIS